MKQKSHFNDYLSFIHKYSITNCYKHCINTFNRYIANHMKGSGRGSFQKMSSLCNSQTKVCINLDLDWTKKSSEFQQLVNIRIYQSI